MKEKKESYFSRVKSFQTVSFQEFLSKIGSNVFEEFHKKGEKVKAWFIFEIKKIAKETELKLSSNVHKKSLLG